MRAPVVFRVPACALLIGAAPACAGAGPAGGGPPAAAAAPPAVRPTLVVLIAVDQLRADYLERFGPQLTGGYARLLREGAVFARAYQDHAISTTAPGHAVLLSGREPYATGIVRNGEGIQDSSVRLLDAPPGRGASPWRFRGSTLVDWLAARDSASRALSVSRKDRGAILAVGRARQQVYWLDRGRFTTSTYYRDELPAWVQAFNADRLSAVVADPEWRPLLADGAYPEADDQPWEHNGADRVFPHRRPNPMPRGDRDYEVTPALDQATLELALRGVRELGLGRGPHTDVLVVSLSVTDHVGHAFGPYSRELHDQVLRVDRWLGTFLDTLLRERERVVVALTGDHGVTPQPEWSLAHGRDAGRHDADSLARALEVRLDTALGTGRWVRFLEKGLVVLTPAAMAEPGARREPPIEAFANEVRRLPGVWRVDTPASLARADTARDAVARRWRKHVPPDLPAVLMITLREGWVFRGARIEASHGHPWDDDTRVPLILSGPGVRPGRHAARVSVADLAPTLARLAGVVPDAPVDGRVLVEALW